MEDRVVLASVSGEIVLKSERTRPRFEQRLIRNILDAFSRSGVGCRRVWIHAARLYVSGCSDGELEKAVDTLTRVFGVHWATVAHVVEYKVLEDLAERVREIAGDWVRGKKFAVRARRSGAEGFTSLEAARVIGAALYPLSAGVDLENPEVEVHVEIRGRRAYVYRETRRGPGGLPVGVEGRVLALFSGGLDSPVAAWMAAKRGAEVDLLHYVLASPASLGDALRVGYRLAGSWLYGYRPRLYAIDFRPVTRAIAGLVERSYAQLVLRLAMYVAAEKMALELGYDALYTGESVGQVSSQTLKNLSALARARPLRVPLIRPLAGLDKEEIVDLTRRIGVYEEASRTREYCRLASGPATTRGSPRKLAEEYAKVESVVEQSTRQYIEIPLV
ncbi:hypothetical protein CF15_00840 [Pyrodictium occultum]|uniref:Probable tRNA sulfurtransferase n=1 Tax=Pyrodictium occultum TaxID=2309 RepID=A0A0V8RTN2_PYROC|nr:tRNA sulfurtransferase [Pyrodictium occultum]KSW11435.1 hypothetical protein CF15_00840 [Pyrodictium occultum]